MTILSILANAAPAPTGNPLVDIPQIFGLNHWGFICQVISFCIVAFLLHKFAYQPVLGALEARRKKIEEGLANAKKIEVQLAEAKKTSEELITKASADANKLIEEARAAAKQVAEREGQRAVAQANEIVQKAREAGEAEQKRLMAELRKDLSRLIVETTAKVTGKVLTAADQQRITEEATKELAA
jgi:F-type H+-transporting ATPase subunit b